MQTRRTVRLSSVTAGVLAVAMLPLPAAFAAGPVDIQKVAAISTAPAVNSDGQVVAFASTAKALVPGDTNNKSDVFAVNRATGELRRVSVDSAGAESNGTSWKAAISADGRYVAFQSDATNLSATDGNGALDVFVYDLETGVTELVSHAPAGTAGAGASQNPAISADGRYVAFASDAPDIVPGDDNGARDVFVWDRTDGTVVRAAERSDTPALSADGRYLAFASNWDGQVAGDTNVTWDIFVRDRQTGQTERVSTSSTGLQGNGSATLPSISADGRLVAFQSAAKNLVPGDSNARTDIFVRDRAAGTTERASVSNAGVQGNNESLRPALSADGRYLVFESYATKLVPGDSNSVRDVFVRDRLARTTTRVSVSGVNGQATGESYGQGMSGDGSTVVYQSIASNLISGDIANTWDVYAVAVATVPVPPMPATLAVARVSAPLGATVDLAATLTAVGTAVAGKTITFTVGGKVAGTAVTDAGGRAVLAYPAETAGSFAVVATFAGDQGYTNAKGTGSLAVKAPVITRKLAVAEAAGLGGDAVELQALYTVSGVAAAGKSINFTVDGVAAGTAVTDDAGIARAPYVITQETGTYAIGAVVAGEPASAMNVLTVLPPDAVLGQLTVANRQVTAGQAATLVATLAATGISPAGKTVVFTVDGAEIGSAETDQFGSATLRYGGALDAGTYLVGASFAGDETVGAAAGTGLLTVAEAAKVAQLAVASMTAKHGETVPLQATLTDAAGPLAGRPVTFRVGASAVGEAVTDAFGMASLPYVVGLSRGDYPVTAAFAGDESYPAASGSGELKVVEEVVVPAAGLAVAPVQGMYGTEAVLRATLQAPGAILAGRTVTFSVSGQPAGAAVTDDQGAATLPVAVTQAAGEYQVTGAFAGAADMTAASGTGTLSVAPAPAVLDYTGDTVSTGGEFRLAARVRAEVGDITLAGPITFTVSQGDTVAGVYESPVDETGLAAVTLPSLAGFYTVTVSLAPVYYTAPDAVAAVTPGVKVSVPAVSGIYAEEVNLRALLNAAGVGLAGQRVAFSMGQEIIGEAVTDQTGEAVLPYAISLKAGSYAVAATFAGDGGYPATKGTGTMTVAKRPVAMTYTGDLLAVGGPVTLRALLEATGGNITLAGPVTFTLGADAFTAPVAADGTAMVELAALQGPATVELSINSPYYTATPVTADLQGAPALVDTVAPVTTATLPAPNADGWYTGTVSVALEAMDPEPGSGVERTVASVGGSPAGATVEADGVHELRFYSVDKAGNVEAEQMVTIQIDSQAPVIAVSNVTEGGSYDVSAAPAWAVTDSLSGVAEVTAMLDGQPWQSGAPVTAAGPHTLVITAADKAGNIVTSATGFGITAAPVFATPVLEAPGARGQYSDAVRLQAALAVGGAPVSGAEIAFQLGGAVVGTAVTDATGVAAIEYAIGLKAGTYEVTAAYAGDDARSLLGARVVSTLTVDLEEAAVTSTGLLTAKVEQAQDGAAGDLSLTRVRFTVTQLNADGTSKVLPAVTVPVDAQGNAKATSDLPAGEYSVVVALDGQGYFQDATGAGAGSVVAAIGSRGSTSGAGWWGTAKDQVEFNLKSKDLIQGQFKLRTARLDLRVTEFDWLMATEKGAQFQGHSGEYTVQVSLVPGQGKTPGRLSITVTRGAQVVYKVVNQVLQGSLHASDR